MKRINTSSGTVWEDLAGYSRAVRVGNQVAVSGTTATDESGQIVGAGDVYQQTVFIIQKIARALQAAGGSLADVVRTRIYVTDITRWQEAPAPTPSSSGTSAPPIP
jgi:enamine deaminase RidA (YjgF/YER057c/UK114 family)